MRCHRIIDDMDLTYKVVAHLVDNDGDIVGLVTDAADGRKAEYRDKAIVFEAMSKLQTRNLVYTGLQSFSIHVKNGKVRLADILSVRYYRDPEQLASAANLFCWTELKQQFSGPQKNLPHKPLPGFPYILHDNAWLLPACVPSPEFLLSILGNVDPIPKRFRSYKELRRAQRAARPPLLYDSKHSQGMEGAKNRIRQRTSSEVFQLAVSGPPSDTLDGSLKRLESDRFQLAEHDSELSSDLTRDTRYIFEHGLPWYRYANALKKIFKRIRF
jgi:hypothetical protein